MKSDLQKRLEADGWVLIGIVNTCLEPYSAPGYGYVMKKERLTDKEVRERFEGNGFVEILVVESYNPFSRRIVPCEREVYGRK